MIPPASILLALSLGQAPVDQPVLNDPLPSEPPVTQPTPLPPPCPPGPGGDPCPGCGLG